MTWDVRGETRDTKHDNGIKKLTLKLAPNDTGLLPIINLLQWKKGSEKEKAVGS